MPWTAIASTVNNEVIISHDDHTLLSEVAEYDFDVSVKIFSITFNEQNSLQKGNYDFRIKYNSLRSTNLVPITKSKQAQELTEIYRQRVNQMIMVRGRFEHALNKHRPLLSQQDYIYDQKVKDAEMYRFASSNASIGGFLLDYAEESNLDINTAANLILEKHRGKQEYLRKIERLRLRHFKKIKLAKTLEEFESASEELDRDFFINMLL